MIGQDHIAIRLAKAVIAAHSYPEGASLAWWISSAIFETVNKLHYATGVKEQYRALAARVAEIGYLRQTGYGQQMCSIHDDEALKLAQEVLDWTGSN